MTTFIKTKFKISDSESPLNFKVKETKIIQIGPEKTTKLYFCGSDSHLGKVQFRILNPNQTPSQRKKNIQIGPETTRLDFCGPDSHLGKVQYRILNPHQISK